MIDDYKGYSARVSIDQQQGLLHGEVLGIVDVVAFQGTTVGELVEAFRESVDDYLDYCRQRGEQPEKPYSGRLVLRMTPEMHRRVAMAAGRQQVSMNDWIVAALDRALQERAAVSVANQRD
jgi:predicted HicB family RNase H-like nuclease